MGRPNEALEYLRRAQAAEPLLFWPSNLLMETYLQTGNLEAGQAEYERGKNLIGPQWLKDASVLARAMAAHDRPVIEQSLLERRDFWNDVMRDGLDHPEAAIEKIRQALSDPAATESELEDGYLAQWAAYLGSTDVALQCLRRAYGPNQLIFAIWRPTLKSVRRTPQFKELVRNLHLPEYWRATGKWGDFCRPIGSVDFECF